MIEVIAFSLSTNGAFSVSSTDEYLDKVSVSREPAVVRAHVGVRGPSLALDAALVTLCRQHHGSGPEPRRCAAARFIFTT